MEADPASSEYQVIMSSFRQMGHALLSAGLEDDLDRLLRIRVLEGGREVRATREQRATPPELYVLERRSR